MSIKDVIKSSVFESFVGNTGMSFWEVAFLLGVACVVGIYIFIVYKLFTKSAFYSKDLNISLPCLTVVVAAVMIAMQSNLLVSFGMVGALSIVRFRTAIKNPIDLVYLFWAISAGIICGVGLYFLSLSLCIIMTVMLWVLDKLPQSRAPRLLVVHTSHEVDTKDLERLIKENCKYYKKSSEIIKKYGKEYIYEVYTIMGSRIVEDVYALSGVEAANLLEHNGELRA